MIAVAGSTGVTGATSTSPPPNRRRRLPVRALPLCAEPVREDSGAVRTDGAVAFRAGAAAEVAAATAAAVAGAFAGAIPQVSQ
jgi:hypothetical protein